MQKRCKGLKGMGFSFYIRCAPSSRAVLRVENELGLERHARTESWFEPDISMDRPAAMSRHPAA